MIQTINITKKMNFEEFVDWYPQDSSERYELHNGEIVQMPLPKGKHSQVAGCLMTELSLEIRRLKLPYFIPRECLIKTDADSGYQPDVIVLNKNKIAKEPLWEKQSTLISGEAIELAIEVVSTNWSDDYALKFDAYEILDIKEYWIVDYLGLGGRKFIGSPKRPTLTINNLENGEYKTKQFRENQEIESLVFSELKLTAAIIFEAE